MPPRVVNVNQVGNGIDAWYYSLPPITRLYGTICFATTVAVSLNLLNPLWMALLWRLVYRKLEIWRLITNFFFIGKFSFAFVIKMLWIINYGVALERQTYAVEPADYAYMLAVCSGLLLAASLALPVYFCADSLIFVLLYLWSRNFPDQRVSLYGLLTIQSFYLPFAFMALTLMFGQSIIPDLLGIVAGHIYYFLKELYPRQSGVRVLETPEWFRNQINSWIPDPDGLRDPLPQRPVWGPQGTAARGMAQGAQGAPQQPPPAQGFRAFSGTGHRLGD